MYAVRLWGIDKANLTADDIDLFVVIEGVRCEDLQGRRQR